MEGLGSSLVLPAVIPTEDRIETKKSPAEAGLFFLAVTYGTGVREATTAGCGLAARSSIFLPYVAAYNRR